MTALVPLHFERADIRMIVRDGEPWWVLADLCAALEISNPRQVASRMDEDEKSAVTLSDGRSAQRREMTIVNEPGLYFVIGRSRQAVKAGTPAHRFRRWVAHDVLPSIRKHGMYPPPPVRTIANDWTDGTARTLGERFREERLRWEEISGHGFENVPGFSLSVIRAIEQGNGGLRKRDRMEMVALAGMDLLYILTGRRTVSPQERRVIDYIRQSGDPRALAMLAVAS